MSFKFFVRAERNNTLSLRITNNRKKIDITLGVQMTQETLEDALSPNPRPQNAKWRSLIVRFQAKLDEIKCGLLKDGRADADPKIIKEIVLRELLNREVNNGSATGEVLTWFTRFADTHPEESKTRALYYHTLSKLRAFCPEFDTLQFKDITVAWLEDFDRFLARTCKLNTRNHHMRNIRAVFKYAIRNDMDIRNPFDRMRLKTEKTRHRSLSLDALRQLFCIEVEPYAEIYRDMFKLSFMLIGINPIDLYRLSGVQDNRIEYRRAKTHKLYSIKVEPEAMEIINRYKGTAALLSLADRWKRHESFISGASTAIRNIGAPRTAPGRSKTGKGLFPELTMYWARHSWATIAASLDIPRDTIAHALGHGGNTVTDIYIDFDQTKVDEANRKVLDWVLYGKR